MTKSLKDISDAMREIDFCTLATRTADGAIASRPMSNNRNVDYDGDSWFFTYDDRQMIRDIESDAHVGATYMGDPGVMGLFGKRDCSSMSRGRPASCATGRRSRCIGKRGWTAGSPQGPATAGLIMVRVTARRIHYWDGMEEGDVALAGAPA